MAAKRKQPSESSSDAGERLLLVDGHAHAYRAFFAIRGLTGPDGRPTNAIFGFRKALEKLHAALSPTHVAVIWDGGLAAERTDALPEYKANRPAMPEALAEQLDDIAAWVEARGWASLCADGVEADDWIAAQARDAEAAGADVLISSSDKDFLQLVTPRVRVVDPREREIRPLDPEAVREKTGVRPDQIVDWLSLIGDSADNIPGVRGVGRKTATALLQRFDSCAGLYARLAEVTPERIRQALADSRELVQRNRELIRLAPEAAVCRPLDELAPREPDRDRLAALYERWGFRAAVEAPAPAQCELF
jgi:DNA polymerase-1